MNYPVKKSHFSVLFQSEFSFSWGCPSSGQLLTLLLVIQNHTGWAPHLHWNRIPPSCFTTQSWPPPILSVYPYNFLLPLSGQESRADIVRQSYKRKCMSRVHPQHIEKGLGHSCRVTQNSSASLQGSWCSQWHLWCENCDSSTLWLWISNLSGSILIEVPTWWSVLHQGRKNLAVWGSTGSWIPQKLFTRTM